MVNGAGTKHESAKNDMHDTSISKFALECIVNWVTSARYLGVHLESSFTFRCSFTANKANFYKTLINSIFGKIGRTASEEVIFALIKSKCLPILLYGTEACPTNTAVRHSLEFAFNKICLKFSAHSLRTHTEISVATLDYVL